MSCLMPSQWRSTNTAEEINLWVVSGAHRAHSHFPRSNGNTHTQTQIVKEKEEQRKVSVSFALYSSNDIIPVQLRQFLM